MNTNTDFELFFRGQAWSKGRILSCNYMDLERVEGGFNNYISFTNKK